MLTSSNSLERGGTGRLSADKVTLIILIAWINLFDFGARAALAGQSDLRAQGISAAIGRELSVRSHLKDGREFSMPLEQLLRHGELLFNANWTEQEGGGRPLTKGTGRLLADPTQPLTNARA